MKNVLILGHQHPIAKAVNRALDDRAGFQPVMLESNDLDHASNYVKTLAHQNVIASFLGPMNVDLAFEALFDAIGQVHPPLTQFLMLSHAGVNSEFKGTVDYPGVSSVKEYLNEQRYAIKVIDESGIPSTILRPVRIVPGSRSAVSVIQEGRPVPAGLVSRQNVVRIALDVIIHQRYLNQSIAIVNRGENND